MEVERLIERYPRLYHMAEAGTWPSIRQHGLLSSNEVVRLAGLTGNARLSMRRDHRPEKVPVVVPSIGTVVLRDQKPMEPGRLQQALVDGTTPAEWYELINARVFFWVREERLLRLLNAQEYEDLEHDVLTLDTASLLAANVDRVRLCHMNSGNTKPIPHHRGKDTFKRIEEYPARVRGGPVKEVVEFTVEDRVDNIRPHVIEVRRMRGTTVLGNLVLD